MKRILQGVCQDLKVDFPDFSLILISGLSDDHGDHGILHVRPYTNLGQLQIVFLHSKYGEEVISKMQS